MEIIKTKSFELATISRGDKTSEKVAILLPGRLDTKDYGNFVSHADYLAGRGFFVVAFDPPGTWDSPGGIELYTTTSYIRAVNELIDYFSNKPTLLLGHSRGAAVAIFVSANPTVTGIVPIMTNFGKPTPPSEEAIEQGFELWLRDLPPGTSRTKEQKEFKLPLAYWEDGKQYNAGETLKTCAKPKLLVYGTNDEFTPTDVAEKLFTQIPEPKMTKRVGCSHDYRYYSEIIKKVETELGRFLEKYRLA